MNDNAEEPTTKPFDLNRAVKLDEDAEAAISDMLTYHPWNGAQQDAGEEVRDALALLMRTVIESVPPGPDRSAGIRMLREARMSFNSAITHHGRY